MSFAAAPDFLVDNEDGEYRVLAFRDEAAMRVSVQKDAGAKNRLKEMRRFPSPPEDDAQISQFTLGDFIGDVYKYEKEKSFSWSMYAASSKAFYVITASSKDAASLALEKFLYSIKLGDQWLIKREIQPNQVAAEAETSIASLQTSPVILQALKKRDGTDSTLKYDLKKTSDADDAADDDKYSRSLITLRKPRADFTDSARQLNVQGTVKLKILFRANGEIGDITVLSELKGGLTKKAAAAARRIKFLPAEINGKAVDVSRTVQYTFTLY